MRKKFEKTTLAGYLPTWTLSRVSLEKLPYADYTHLLFFSAKPKPSGTLDTSPFTLRALEKFVALCRKNRTKPLLCVGGWGRSKGFVKLAARKNSRALFCRNVFAFLEKFDLEGLDIDWEYPKGAAERQALTRLLADLHPAFEEKGWRLSIAVPGTWSVIEKASLAFVHAVHIMAYDLGEPHASLEKSRAALSFWKSFGVPRAKRILGVPFYGKKRKHALAYRALFEKFRPLASKNEAGGYFFIGPKTMEQLGRFIRKNAAGAMVWEITGDTPKKTLLRALRKELMR